MDMLQEVPGPRRQTGRQVPRVPIRGVRKHSATLVVEHDASRTGQHFATPALIDPKHGRAARPAAPRRAATRMRTDGTLHYPGGAGALVFRLRPVLACPCILYPISQPLLHCCVPRAQRVPQGCCGRPSSTPPRVQSTHASRSRAVRRFVATTRGPAAVSLPAASFPPRAERAESARGAVDTLSSGGRV
jgi:hypothetical protein